MDEQREEVEKAHDLLLEWKSPHVDDLLRIGRDDFIPFIIPIKRGKRIGIRRLEE